MQRQHEKQTCYKFSKERKIAWVNFVLCGYIFLHVVFQAIFYRNKSSNIYDLGSFLFILMMSFDAVLASILIIRNTNREKAVVLQKISAYSGFALVPTLLTAYIIKDLNFLIMQSWVLFVLSIIVFWLYFTFKFYRDQNILRDSGESYEVNDYKRGL